MHAMDDFENIFSTEEMETQNLDDLPDLKNLLVQQEFTKRVARYRQNTLATTTKPTKDSSIVLQTDSPMTRNIGERGCIACDIIFSEARELSDHLTTPEHTEIIRSLTSEQRKKLTKLARNCCPYNCYVYFPTARGLKIHNGLKHKDQNH